MQPTKLQLKVDDDSWLKVGKINREFREHIHIHIFSGNDTKIIGISILFFQMKHYKKSDKGILLIPQNKENEIHQRNLFL